MSVLVNNLAPNFTACAVMPDGSFKEDFSLKDYSGKNVVLFFWPLDFTFVCPTEILAHHSRLPEFEKRNTQVIGISIDSHFTHAAWRNTPVNAGGISQVKFPIVSDINKEITEAYGVKHEAGVALRASFLIDKNGLVQHKQVNNLPLGRNVDEMIRMVDALDFFEKNGEVCPAGWQKGDAGMKADAKGVSDYLKSNADDL